MSAPVQTASWAHRLLALIVDWIGCWLVVLGLSAFLTIDRQSANVYVLAVFLAESTLFTALLGGSFGKLMTRLRVTRMDGSLRPPDLLRSLVRQFLVALVIPVLVFRPDGRGLHDMAADTSTNTLASILAR